MSEKIVHTAVVDDCARIVQQDAAICPAFKTVLAEHLELARLGGATRLGDRHNPGLLTRYRELWPERGRHPALGAKLAFVLGWLSHRAADRNFKRVFRALDADCPHRPTDCSIYQDAEIMRQVYAGQFPFPSHAVEPGMASHPAAAAVSVDAVADLFEGMWQRFLIRIHTFIPDDTDPDAWLEQVVRLHQARTVDLRRYAEAYLAPDPDKVRRFIVDCNFYNPADPLLRQLAALRQGGQLAGLTPAVEEGPAASLYARAVSRAYRYARAASDYFGHCIGREDLLRRLEIGKPEVLGADE